MALTTLQLEAHLGRFLRTLAAGLSTEDQLAHLDDTMRLLLPAGKRYVTNGTLGTQAERLEAMTTLRDAAWEKITGVDPAGNTPLLHYLNNHWQAGEP